MGVNDEKILNLSIYCGLELRILAYACISGSSWRGHGGHGDGHGGRGTRRRISWRIPMETVSVPNFGRQDYSCQ